MKTLYAKQKVFKIEDHYAVTDARGEAVYYIDQHIKFFGYEVHVSDRDRTPVFTIRQEMLHFLPTFRAIFDTGEEMEVKARFNPIKKKIDIIYEGKALLISGDIWSWDFAITDEQRREVASITRKILAWGDTFVLDIVDDAYQDAAVAAMIAIDRIVDLEQSSN
ncbi:MAG: LURP-one-related family protein [Peptoniphilus sp.]|nr:LURP-one-related family protein [Peptoniphilus sp.]MDD7362870.1 LURP-one-related family protein [Bacillota bacterium]MDY6044889.1 LURP-one-related family protein [Peptoniphilus sp.]